MPEADARAGAAGPDARAGAAGPHAPADGPTLAYIPALDGIRGLAMVVIMGYHGGVFFQSGGFYSLDTFFALSGFLITSLLVAEWQRNSSVGLRLFWARRARRLLPGLVVMLLGVSLYAAFLVPAGTYPDLRADGLSSLFYFANWHFIASGSNYFDKTGLASPLLHMWSLAVEEQFYLLWPLVVLGILKAGRSLRVLLVACTAGALASALEMALLYNPSDVNRLYYGTDTRAQSLLVGSALAVALALWAERRRRLGAASLTVTARGWGGDPAWAAATPSGRRVLLSLGLLGVAGSAALWILVSSNDAFAYRGGFLLAALSTALLLVSVVCAQRSVLARGLSLAPVRYLGRISYGMYLWHWPLFLYIDGARTGLTGDALFGLRALATIAVATVSFYAVERPVRQGRFRRGRRPWLVAPAAVAATAAALLASTVVPAVALASNGPAKVAPTPARQEQGKAPPLPVLIVGDSTALTVAIGLDGSAPAYGVSSHDGGILGCGVTSGAEYQLKGVDAPMASQCTGSVSTEQWPQVWRGFIARWHPRVVMILAGRWEVSNRTYRGRWTDILDPLYAAYVKQQLEHGVAVAGSSGAHVVLMTAPCYDSGEQPDGRAWPEDSRQRLSVYNALVRQVAARSPNTAVLDFNAMACPGGRYDQYFGSTQVRLADGVHFAFDGGAAFASRIWPAIVALDRGPRAAPAAG
ncbi:MAG TPA: acyltransferase family protein [Acidimicrobiales bacterium]|nr:acyltransferase family protein [Acidimicrobiales bacterium]